MLRPKIQVITSIGVFLIATSALLGWTLNISSLKSIMPGFVAMNPMTALLFLLLAISLFLQQEENKPSGQLIVARLLGFAVLSIGLLRVFGYGLNSDIGIDQILFTNVLADNRMAPNTAFNFILLGTAVLFLNKSFRGFHVAPYLGGLAFLISYFAIIGYGYGMRAMYGILAFIPMALNTGIAFLLMSIGILYARPTNGFMVLLTDKGMTGFIIRRLLPAMLFVTPFLGWLRLEGQKRGSFDLEIGVSLMVIMNTVICIFIVFLISHSLRKMDLMRTAAQARIQKLNADLEVRSNELQMTNKELEAFSYSVSHDLRAPLRHIDGFIDLVQKNTSLSKDQTLGRYLNIISDSARQMGCLIDDLLIFSRMGRAQMDKSLVDMNQLVTEAISALAHETKERKIDWAIHQLPSVHGDRSMLKLVYANLIGNAIKYSRNTPQPRIEIGCSKNGTSTEFFVKDNGAGFEMEYVEKLFGVFQRLHSSEEFEGTGIGLANVKRIVLRHGGSVRAEGAVGKGAGFYFSIPTNKQEEA